MIVFCINGEFTGDRLIVGESYEVLNETIYYVIKHEDGSICKWAKDRFKSVADIREDRLKELGIS